MDLAMVQPGDFAFFLGALVDFEKLALHAGGGEELAIVLQ